MNTQTVAPAVTVTPIFNVALTPGNRAYNRALCLAISAIHALDAAGSTVIDIDIRGGTPVLRIDQPPAFVRGVASVSCPSGRFRQILRRAPYYGAQIEWIERELRASVHGAVQGGA